MADFPVTAAMTTTIAECRAVLRPAEALLEAGRAALAPQVAPQGRLDPAALEAAQLGAHGLAWAATYVEALRQALRWAERLEAAGRLGPVEGAMLVLGFAEYGAQLAGGIPMSQMEVARPADYGVPEDAAAALRAALAPLSTRLDAARAVLLGALGAGEFGAVGLDDPGMEMLRDQFARFTAAEVTPHAQGLARRERADSARSDREARRSRHLRRHHRGGGWRARPRQGRDVPRLRDAERGLCRRRQPRHAERDRRRADRAERHPGAEGALAARHRERRDPADGGVHRAQHGIGPREPPHSARCATAMSTACRARRPGSPMAAAATS
jgi:hypothetical protein